MIREYDSIIKARYQDKDYFVDLSRKDTPVSLEGSVEHNVYQVNVGMEDEDPYYILYVTDACNMRCPYCFNEIDKNERLCNGSPVFDVKQFADYVQKQGYKESVAIRFFGGEPLLNTKWIKECVAEMEARSIPCEYNVFTNATLLDEAFLSFAEEHAFTFYVSINGGNDEYKGKLFKEQIFKGIRQLKERDFYVNARMVWVPNEKETLKDLVVDAVTNGVRAISIVLPWGMAADAETSRLFTEQLTGFTDFYLSSILKHDYRYTGIDPLVSYLSKWLLNKQYGDVTCGAGKNVTCIGTDGKCYPCHCFVNIDEYSCGTLKEGSSALFPDLAADTITPCKDCEIRYFCKAKCVADAFYTHKDPYHMNEFKCFTEKAFVGASAYVLSELQKKPDEFRIFRHLISKGGERYIKNR